MTGREARGTGACSVVHDLDHGVIRTRRRLWVAGLTVVIALAYILSQGLDSATLYFRTADEAVAQRGELGARRFRIEGDVVPGSVSRSGQDVTFTLTANSVQVAVRHKGDPPELFQPGIPVVLEGSFSGDLFASDRMMVKHSETYLADNPQRVPTGQ